MASVYKVKRKGSISYGITYYTPDGTRIRKVIGPKWADADDYRKQVEKELREGRWELLSAKEIVFAEFAKEYLKSKQAKSTPKTFTTYFYWIDRILVPYFGRYYLHQVTPQLIDRFIVESRKRGVAPLTVTVNGYLRVLSAMLNKAVQWGYKARNVVSGVKRLRAPEKEARFLIYEDAARLLESVRYTRISPIVGLGLLAGLRKAEILNVRWKDIDFGKAFIRVINRPDEGFQTKNYRNRTVGLHPDLGKMLFWWKSTSAARVRIHKESRSQFIVTYKGDQIASAERALRSAYKKAGLSSERPFHTLRHSFGSYLAMEGVSLYEIAKLMGHTFEQVTQLYAHLQPEYLHKQVAKIPALTFTARAQNVPKTNVDASKLVEIAQHQKKVLRAKNSG
jgi:integrase